MTGANRTRANEIAPAKPEQATVSGNTPSLSQAGAGRPLRDAKPNSSLSDNLSRDIGSDAIDSSALIHTSTLYHGIVHQTPSARHAMPCFARPRNDGNEAESEDDDESEDTSHIIHFPEYLIMRLHDTENLPGSLNDHSQTLLLGMLERNTPSGAQRSCCFWESDEDSLTPEDRDVVLAQALREHIAKLDYLCDAELIDTAVSKYKISLSEAMQQLDYPGDDALSKDFVERYGFTKGGKRALVAHIASMYKPVDRSSAGVKADLRRELEQEEFEARGKSIRAARARLGRLSVADLLMHVRYCLEEDKREQPYCLPVRQKLLYVLDRYEKDGLYTWAKEGTKLERTVRKLRRHKKLLVNDEATLSLDPLPTGYRSRKWEEQDYDRHPANRSHKEIEKREKELREKFDKYDTNNSKDLDVKEEILKLFRWWLRKFQKNEPAEGEDLNEDQLGDYITFMKNMDVNDDGKISFEEFQKAIGSVRTAIRKYRLATRLEQELKAELLDVMVGPENFSSTEKQDWKGWLGIKASRQHAWRDKNNAKLWRNLQTFENITGMPALHDRATRNRLSRKSLQANLRINDYVKQRDDLINRMVRQELKRTWLRPSCWLSSCQARRCIHVCFLERKHATLNDADLRTKEEKQLQTKRVGMEKFEGKAPCFDHGCCSTNSFFQILFSWTGTVLPMAMRSGQMYLSIIVYLLVRVLIRFQTEVAFFPPLEQQGVGILGQFLSFFLVFYAGQAYTRFVAQFSTSSSCKNRIREWSLHGRRYSNPCSCRCSCRCICICICI